MFCAIHSIGKYVLSSKFTAGIVGFHDNNSTNDFELPYSGSVNVDRLPMNSNIRVEGIYVYRIDEDQIRGIASMK